MYRDRMAEQAGRDGVAVRTDAGLAARNSVGLGIIGLLAFMITATGFRSGSVWWMLAAMGQFLVVGARVGVFSAEAWRERGATVTMCGLEFHRVSCRLVLELYLALLLSLPFVTMFDERGWEGF